MNDVFVYYVEVVTAGANAWIFLATIVQFQAYSLYFDDKYQWVRGYGALYLNTTYRELNFKPKHIMTLSVNVG
jgi:hypothetical protein